MTTEKVTGMIVVVGDPLHGFVLHGPFRNGFEANLYGESLLEIGTWWILPLIKLQLQREDGDRE